MLVPAALGDAVTEEVTVSYFEWVQNAQNLSWEEERVSDELERRMRRAHEAVRKQAAEADPSPRDAAFTVAVGKVARATELRGL